LAAVFAMIVRPAEAPPGSTADAGVADASTSAPTFGVAVVSVPDLRFRSVDTADAALNQAGLTTGVRSKSFDQEVPTALVVGTNPRAGVQVLRGAVIDYVVSLGPAPTAASRLTAAPLVTAGPGEWLEWSWDERASQWHVTARIGPPPPMRAECQRGPDGLLQCRDVPDTTVDVRCAVPLRTSADIAECRGQWLPLAIDNGSTRTVYKVAMASRGQDEIAATLASAMMAYRAPPDEITIFAFGSEADYFGGSPYNRGTVVTHDGIAEFAVCTEWYEPPIDTCSAESTFSVALDE
jgi:hypothetical protein